MSRLSRTKGQRVERQLVALHQDHAIPCCKASRSGYTGHDLLVCDEFRCEVKSRKDGSGFTQLERWLGDNDILLLKRNRQLPLVVLPWATYVTLLTGYLRHQLGVEDIPDVPL